MFVSRVLTSCTLSVSPAKGSKLACKSNIVFPANTADRFGAALTRALVCLICFDVYLKLIQLKDFNHPALGGGFGPGFKVAGGFDFVGDDFTGKALSRIHVSPKILKYTRRR